VPADQRRVADALPSAEAEASTLRPAGCVVSRLALAFALPFRSALPSRLRDFGCSDDAVVVELLVVGRDGAQHAVHCGKGTVLIAVVAAPVAIEMAKEFVRAIEKMNDHGLRVL